MIYELLALLISIYVLYKVVLSYLDVLPDVKGKTVLITGCDSGFGNALALKCLSYGMVVFAGCLTEQGILELKSTAAKLPGILHTIKVDVTADDSVNEAKATVTKLLNKNGLDGIVNNAGVAACAYDDWITVKDYKNILEVNLFGVIRVTHAFKDLVKKNRGRIVNVSSVLSMVSLGSLAQYAVSKFGVKAFSDAIRTEYKQFGVTVSTLEPGFFRTQLAAPEPNAKRLQRVWDNLPQDIKDEYGEGYYQKVSRTAYEFLDSVGSTDTYKVVDAYFHALTSKYPKAKYHVGHDYYLFFFLSLLPAVVRDYIIYFGMWIKNVPKPNSMK